MPVQKFRLIAKEFEAIQYTGDNFNEIREFVPGVKKVENRLPGHIYPDLRFNTQDAQISISPGIWIIKNEKGFNTYNGINIFEDAEPIWEED